MSTTTTTYTKLKDGSWGIRVPGQARKGQEYSVSKRDGTSKRETIRAVLWTGTDKSGATVSLCAIGTSRGTSVGGGDRRCKSCGGPVVDAPHHRAMSGYCGSCAFDEFDM